MVEPQSKEIHTRTETSSSFDDNSEDEPVSIGPNKRFWLTSLKVDDARAKLQPQLGSSVDFILCSIDQEISNAPSMLGHIYQFSRLILKSSSEFLIMCVPPGRWGITTAAVLLGGYLAVCEHMEPEQLSQEFCALSPLFLAFNDADGEENLALTVMDCWSALHRATASGWLDFSDKPSEDSMDMEEHLHYDSLANGQIHVVVPNKLLAFACPSDLPEGKLWSDQGGARRFSPSYYGDVLGDFDVSVAVCCCGANAAGPPYDAAAMAGRGVALEALPADARSGRLLAAVDRLLTLARAAPGALALHGSGRWEEGLLLSACLIRLFGFPAGPAIAWARMSHPPAAVPAPRLAYFPAGAAGPDAGKAARRN